MTTSSSKAGIFFAFAAAILCGSIAYAGVLNRTIEVWTGSPDEQHGFLVIPIALLLLYLRRPSFPSGTARLDLRGLVLLALAAGMRIYSERYIRPWMEMWSFPLWIGGAVWLFGGWKVFRWAAPVIAFLLFMAPLPGQVQTAAGYPLQLLAASVSGWVLQMLGQPAFVAGTTILLGDQTLDVERACAGLRMFHGMLAVAFAWSLFCRYNWPRFVFTMAVAPLIAIIVNVIRIVATGLLVQRLGSETAQSLSHDWAGMVMIPSGAVLFFLLDGLIDRLIRWNEERPERAMTAATVGLSLVATLGFGAYLLHQRQQQRSLDVVLEQARSLSQSELEEGQIRAIDFYQRYLSARETDAEVLSELARLQSSLGIDRTERAARLHLLAWRQDETRDADAIESLSLLKDLSKWQQLWNRAREVVPQLDGESRITAIRLQTDAITQMMRDPTFGLQAEAMVRACRNAIESDPDYFEHMLCLALLVRSHPELARKSDWISINPASPSDNRITESDELIESLAIADAAAIRVMNRCVAEHPEKARPWLYLASLLEAANQQGLTQAQVEELIGAIDRSLDVALELVAKKRSKSGKEPEVVTDPTSEATLTASVAYRMAGDRALARDDVEAARNFLLQAKAVNPKDHRVYLSLYRILDPNDTEGVIALFEEATAACGPNELTLVLPLAEAYLSIGRQDEAEAILEPFERLLPQMNRVDRGRVELLLAVTRASGFAKRQRQREAAELLAASLHSPTVVSQRLFFTEIYSQAQFQLGGLFRELGQDAAAAMAFQEGGRLDPESPAWHIDAGQAHEASGNLTAALEHYERAAAVAGRQQPLVYLAIARVLLAQQKAVTRRDLGRARQMIRRAAEQGADVDLTTAMLAESFVVQEDLKGAIQVIDQQLDETPRALRLLFSRAMIHQLSGDIESAVADAKRYEAAGATPSESLLLRVLIYQRAGRLDDANDEIRQASVQFESGDLKDARTQLVVGLLQSGQLEEGASKLRTLAETYSTDLSTQRMAAEVFSDLQMDDAVENAERNLKRIEGDDGTLWRAARAERLLRAAEGTEDRSVSEKLAEQAAQLIDRLQQLIPNWPETYRLQGQLAERSGRWSDALSSYQLAWSAGSRDAGLAARILNAMNQAGQSWNVPNFITQLEDLIPRSTSLFDRAMPSYVQISRGDFVLQLARRWAEEDPNPDNLVRLGQTLMAITGSTRDRDRTRPNETREEAITEAEEALSQAIEEDPTNLNAWIALFQLNAEIREDRQRAFSQLQEFSDQLSIDPLQKSFVLAQLNAAIGENARAGELFERTIKLAQQTTATVRATISLTAIGFLSTRRHERAMELCRDLLREAPNSPVVNTYLIRLLAMQGTRASLDEAVDLQRKLMASLDSTDGDQTRMLARLLAARANLDEPKPETARSSRGQITASVQRRVTSGYRPKSTSSERDQSEAIRLLEGLVPRSAEDAEMLAELYHKRDQPIRAFNFYRESLRLEVAPPDRLVRFLDFWNESYAAEGTYRPIADQYLSELANYPDAASGWLRLSLQRVEREAAAADVSATGENATDSGPAEVLDRFIAVFANNADQGMAKKAATQMFTGLADSGRSDLIDGVIDSLSRSGAEPDTIVNSLAVVLMRLSGNIESDATKDLVKAIAEMGPLNDEVSVKTLTLIGDALYVGGASELALPYYRKAMKRSPEYVDAINNLAIVLADRDETDDEASSLAEQAVKLEPENPDRRDTKLVVALLREDWELAESIAASLSGEYSPTILLHRSNLALERGRLTEAEELLARCREGFIESMLIAPVDKRMYRALVEKFFPSGGASVSAQSPSVPLPNRAGTVARDLGSPLLQFACNWYLPASLGRGTGRAGQFRAFNSSSRCDPGLSRSMVHGFGSRAFGRQVDAGSYCDVDQQRSPLTAPG